MSTLKVNTIQNVAGSKSVSTDTVVDGTAKAWVNFNGTGTVAIRASFNITSITDNGVGDYTINMTNAISDANYTVVASAGGLGGNASMVRLADEATARTVSLFRIAVLNSTNAGASDVPQVNISVFR